MHKNTTKYAIEVFTIWLYFLIMSLKRLFGKRIQKLRKERGLTQEKFSELVKYEANTIGQIECGLRSPSFKAIERIATELKINYYELFDFEETQTENSLIKAIVKELEGTNKKFLQHILNTIIELKKFLRIK